MGALEVKDENEAYGIMYNSMLHYAQSIDEKGEFDTYSAFDKWTGEHSNAMQMDDEGNLIYNSELGISFDIMEGKDATNEKAYNEQTLKFAQGEVNAKDSSNNGELDFNEYFIGEAGKYIEECKNSIANGQMDLNDAVDMLSETYLDAQLVFKMIDIQLGDENGQLNAAELQSFYKYMDSFDGNEDGKFNIDKVLEYPEYLTSQIDKSKFDISGIKNVIRDFLKA